MEINRRNVLSLQVARALINPLNADLNRIYQLLALLGAQPILYISGVGVNAIICSQIAVKF
jgi:hypothetical protein